MGHIPIWLGSGNIQYMTQTRPTWIPGNNSAHMTAKMVIASAARLIEVRHFCRKKEDRRDERPGVPDADPEHEVRDVPRPADGDVESQTPIPSQKSHETAAPRRPRSARAGMKKSHQPIGAGRSTGPATASVIEWKSGERRMSVGWPATGLSSSSASVWAKPVPPISKVVVCTVAHSLESSARLRARLSGALSEDLAEPFAAEAAETALRLMARP